MGRQVPGEQFLDAIDGMSNQRRDVFDEIGFGGQVGICAAHDFIGSAGQSMGDSMLWPALRFAETSVALSTRIRDVRCHEICKTSVSLKLEPTPAPPVA